ncbi:MAG: BamA/TamA family outer membrane protein, partial [Bacteroidota bacterium]
MKNYFNPFVISLLAYLSFGCIGTKHLKEGEYLLYNQKVEAPKEVSKDELDNQYTQRHNSRIWKLPIAPYTNLYYSGLKRYDTTRYQAKKQKISNKFDQKIANAGSKEKKVRRLERKQESKLDKINKIIEEGNLRMRWGEPIVVFDSSKVKRTKRNLEVFMHSNGWLHAEADYAIKYNKKIATVNYSIEEGPRYVIDTLFYSIADKDVKSIVMDHQEKSLVKQGEHYSQDNLRNERIRIDELLKNNGYFDFSRQYIRFRIDSTGGNHSIKIQLQILSPSNLSAHKSFTVDSVNFNVDISGTQKHINPKPFVYKGVTYNFNERYYSEKVLGRRIHLKPGEVYSKQNTLDTQRELAGMDMFKFVNINYDSTANRFLANIFVSPLHRYQWTAEAGLTVTRSLPGPFASISLKKRNVFKTLGILELSGNIGVEGVAAASNPDAVLASLEAGGMVSLTFPKFFLPITDETKQKLGFYNPKTVVSVGVTFTDRPEYSRSNLSAANYYTWQPEQNLIYDFRLAEVALTRTYALDSAYHQRLKELELNGNNLINSFRPSFISNQRLTISHNKNNYGRTFENSSYLSLMFEPGGTLTNLWAKDIFAKDSLETYAYLKIDADYRKNIKTGKRKSVTFRVRSGIAYPYGENGLLPYEKYFFSGGSISNRAWKPRRLGPGSYNHVEEDGLVSYRFEQQGEIIFESSIEYRQKLVGFLEWAAFVDAGNIWTINEDPTRPGAQFQLNR